MKNFTEEQKAIIRKAVIDSVANNMNAMSSINNLIMSSDLDEDLTRIVQYMALASRHFASNAHKLKMYHDWSVSPTPEWFDHYIDQFYQTEQGLSLWMERGVYNVNALKRGGAVLEMCCGDGFNTKVFYAPLAKSVIAVDFDQDAVNHARKHNQAPNITYIHQDIRHSLPGGKFDNIIWDAAIEHFTEQEIGQIIEAIKDRMNNDSILSGYTIVEIGDGHKHLHQHEREFKSKEDLASFLTPHFKNVRVFETVHPTRHNLYFYASDAAVPFDNGWSMGLSIHTPRP